MTKNALTRAWIISIVGYLLYWLGNKIPAPFMSTDFYQLTRNSHVLNTNFANLFQFGIMPLVSAFFLVELFSFFLKPLKTWRESGSLGRGNLNRLSLLLSLVLVTIQAYGFISRMKGMALLDGEMVWQNLSFLQEMVVVSFYWVGTFVIYALGQWMTKNGISNGFGFIIIVDVIFSLSKAIGSHVDSAIHSDQRYYMPGLAFLALAVYVLWRFLLKKRVVATAEFKNTQIQYQLPILPQGLMGHVWTLNLVLLPFSLQSFYEFSLYSYDSWPYILSYVILAPLVSYFAFYVAYSPRRILNNVSDITLNDEFTMRSKKHLGLAILILTGFSFLLLMPRPFETSGKFLSQIFTLNQLILIYVIGLDIIRHSRFLKVNPQTVCLLTLDNIHLAEAQRALLQSHNIESHIQGQQFRTIYAFTNPMYKMSLIVNQKDSEKAQQLLQLDDIKIV